MTKKALSLEEFMDMPHDLQFETLHRNGVYVGKRKIGKQTIVLLQLYSFYVEVYYKQYRKTIERLETSSTTEILQPYLDQINVRDLNNDKEKK